MEFAEQITKLNTGEQSIDETLSNISKMLKEPRLYDRLRLLIKQAADDKFK
jgi:hypothetical protein